MDIDKELSVIFSEVLKEIIATFSGFSLDIMSNEADNDFDEMTGVMSLNGEKNGILFLSAKEKDIRSLCSYIIGADNDEITGEDIEDTLCELVNMTAGSAKLRLSGSDYVFNLSAPFILKGQNMRVVGKKKTRVISNTLGNDEITIKVKVVY